MKEALNKIFNWRKNPSSVFLFAIPLAAQGFFIIFWHSYLYYKETGSIGYFVISFLGFILLIVGLIPAYRIHKINKKFENMKKD